MSLSGPVQGPLLTRHSSGLRSLLQRVGEAALTVEALGTTQTTRANNDKVELRDLIETVDQRHNNSLRAETGALTRQLDSLAASDRSLLTTSSQLRPSSRILCEEAKTRVKGTQAFNLKVRR